MDQQPYVVYLTSSPNTIAIDPACQSDAHYRYKMTQLVVQTIGNGKMIRTSFTNLDDVSKELKIPPDYIPHYLAKAIGAQAKYDKAKPARERGSISGEHSTTELSNLLVRFIRDFVLCPKCKLPELNYTGKKNDLALRCHGCGHRGLLSANGTLNEKFKRYVYTHPPPAVKESRSKSTGKSASGAAAPVPVRAAASNTTEENGKDHEAKSTGTKKGAGKAEQVVWHSDLSDKAAQERLETMVPDRLKRLVALEGEPEPEHENMTPAQQLRAIISAKPAISQNELIAEVQRLQTRYSLDKKALTQLIFDVFLADLKQIRNAIKPNKDLLAKFIGSQPLAQAVLISCIEKAVTDLKSDKDRTEFLSKHALLAFKELYDEDVLEEDVLLQWYRAIEDESQRAKDPLRKALEKFCTWLEEAESESEGSEDEEDGNESEQQQQQQQQQAAAATTTTTTMSTKAATPAAAPAATKVAAKEEKKPKEDLKSIDEEIDAL